MNRTRLVLVGTGVVMALSLGILLDSLMRNSEWSRRVLPQPGNQSRNLAPVANEGAESLARALEQQNHGLQIYQDRRRGERRRSRGDEYRGGYGGYGGYSSRRSDPRGGVPNWTNDSEFKHDVFTFARVRYTSSLTQWRGGNWRVDYPDSDLNFSYRLQELTSMKVDPDGVVVELTDENLFDYPFLYLIEPGWIALTEAEEEGLRKYLLRGGFLMVDDFWGEEEWYNFHRQIRRVFPTQELKELELDHPIFHWVYDLAEKPQIPSIGVYMRGYRTERWDAEEPHYWGLFDDDGRMMAFICHNTDLGDGWEREGENEIYFKEISERWAYPLGINIVTYAMTH